MTKYEEIYLISNIISNAKEDSSVAIDNQDIWQTLFLSDKTQISEDYFYKLDEQGVLDYEEIGEDGFKPIVMCSIKPETSQYLKQLVTSVTNEASEKQMEIEKLNTRITEILTFNPEKLSDEIRSTENIILQTRQQLSLNPVLQPLIAQLDQIEVHFKSLSKVANNYEEVYKNIILPVREEGKSGVRQTVRWAIISIIISTLLSVLFSWLMK